MKRGALPRLAVLLKAAAHPVRLDIIFILEELDGANAATLLDLTEVTKSDLTRHLKVLEDAGIISREREKIYHIFTLISGSLPEGLRQLYKP